MSGGILNIIALIVFAGFMACMLFTKGGDKNRLYIKYILLAYPLIALHVLPGPLRFNNFFLITLVFLFLFYRPKKVKIKYGPLYLVLFLITMAIGITGSILAESLTAESMRSGIEFFSIFIFAKILIDECIDDPFFFYDVISWVKTAAVISLIFLCFQFVLGTKFSLSESQNPNILQDTSIRYPSYFQDPQKYAQFLAATSFLWLIKEWKSISLSAKNYIFLVLTLIGILYTGGRGGLGGWALGFSLVVLFGNATYKIYAFLVCLAMFVVIYNFQNSFALFNRGDNLSDSYDFRFAIWQDAFKIFLNNPFFGIAPGNYANYVSVHNPDQYWVLDNDIVYYDHPESGYLKLLTEYGAIGFAALMSLIIIPMINAFLNFLKTKDTSFLLMISAVLSWMMGFYTVFSLGDIRISILIATLVCLLITNYKRFSPQYNEEA